MRMTYLGLFQKVFDWVFDRILSPVFQVVAEVLSKVFEWLFNNILVPVLTLVLQTVVPWIVELYYNIYSTFLFMILRYLCKIIDYIQISFNVFIGASEVSVGSGATAQSMPLLDALMWQPTVNKAFWIITALGLGIAMILCIYATMKSTLDFDFENKRPVGAVLKSMMKCFIQFLTVPFFTLFLLKLAGLVMKVINLATYDPNKSPASLGSILFCLASLDACKDPRYNISSKVAGVDYMTTGIRGDYFTGKEDYMDMDRVFDYFSVTEFDYFTGIVLALFLAVILLICIITFIQRLFEIIVLYLVSPLFVATMPLDDGEKFSKWRELFIAKVFSGYGSVLSMNIYLMLCPIILGNSITWGSAGTSQEATYLIKMIFLVGGAWAMLKIGPMVTQLLSYQAGIAEEATGNMVSGYAQMKLMNGTRALAFKAVGTMKKAGASSMNAFKAGHNNRMGIANGKMQKLDKMGGLKKSGAIGAAAGATGAAKSANKPSAVSRKVDLSNRKYTGGFGRAANTSKIDRALHKVHNVLPLSSGSDGSYSFGMLGFKVRYDQDGHRTGFKIPCVNFQYDTEGKCSVGKISLGKIGAISRQGSDGKFKVSDIPAFGVHRVENKDGVMHTASAMGVHRTEGVDGSFHVSDAFGVHREMADDGTFHTTSAMGIKFAHDYNASEGQYERSAVRVGSLVFRTGDPGRFSNPAPTGTTTTPSTATSAAKGASISEKTSKSGKF